MLGGVKVHRRHHFHRLHRALDDAPELSLKLLPRRSESSRLAAEALIHESVRQLSKGQKVHFAAILQGRCCGVVSQRRAARAYPVTLRNVLERRRQAERVVAVIAPVAQNHLIFMVASVAQGANLVEANRGVPRQLRRLAALRSRAHFCVIWICQWGRRLRVRHLVVVGIVQMPCAAAAVAAVAIVILLVGVAVPLLRTLRKVSDSISHFVRRVVAKMPRFVRHIVVVIRASRHDR
mmetsp:Transcript_6933/g.17924  ORF Transcript_6933/g.17924 Transcript_6933/m.17924 type:complete len:236 (+) Transcript_6933:516-1223(+)